MVKYTFVFKDRPSITIEAETLADAYEELRKVHPASNKNILLKVEFA